MGQPRCQKIFHLWLKIIFQSIKCTSRQSKLIEDCFTITVWHLALMDAEQWFPGRGHRWCWSMNKWLKIPTIVHNPRGSVTKISASPVIEKLLPCLISSFSQSNTCSPVKPHGSFTILHFSSIFFTISFHSFQTSFTLIISFIIVSLIITVRSKCSNKQCFVIKTAGEMRKERSSVHKLSYLHTSAPRDIHSTTEQLQTRSYHRWIFLQQIKSFLDEIVCLNIFLEIVKDFTRRKEPP